MVNFSALGNNLSLLPFLLGSTSASGDPLAALFGATNPDPPPDPFTQLLLDRGSQVTQTLTIAENAAASHSLQSAAQPFLPGPLSIFSPAHEPSPNLVDSAAQKLIDSINSSLASSLASTSALSTISQFLQSQAAPLSAIGITSDSTGKLILDVTKLNAALTNQPNQVEQLLGGTGGLAQTVTSNAQLFLGQSLGFPGGMSSNASVDSLLAASPGLFLNLLA